MKRLASLLVLLSLIGPAWAGGPWFVNSNATGTADGLSWVNAKTTLAAAQTASSAGDTVWVGDNSAETQASLMTITSPGTSAAPNMVWCADHTVASPGTGDLKTTCSVTTTGSNGINFVGSAYYYGITFNSGTGAGGGAIKLDNTASGFLKFENSNLFMLGTGTLQFFCGVAGNNAVKINLANTNLKFGAVGQSIILNGCDLTMRGGALQGSAPTSLFTTSGAPSIVTFEGVDASIMVTGKTFVPDLASPHRLYFKDQKIGATPVYCATFTNQGGPEVRWFRSDSAGTNYVSGKCTYRGTMTPNVAVIHTGGANDGVQGFSWNITTGANDSWISPFGAEPIASNISTTGASIIATLQAISNTAAIPTTKDIWTQVEYLGSGSSPLGSFVSGTIANGLATGTNLTASTEAWDSVATAWAAATAYPVGTARKFTGCTGQIYFVSAISGTGTSGGSQPACQSDGGTVVDNSGANQITWRAGWRFSIDTTITSPNAGQKGYALVTPIVSTASLGSATVPGVFIDPLVTQH